MTSMDNTPDSPAKTPVGYTTQGGNYWTLITPEIWKVLHAVLHLHDQVLRHPLIKGVADQFTVKQVLDACKVKPSLAGCHVRYIGDPGTIWGGYTYRYASVRQEVFRGPLGASFSLSSSGEGARWPILCHRLSLLVSAGTHAQRWFSKLKRIPIWIWNSLSLPTAI